MSVEAMALVLHHSEAKGTEKLVLLGIANHEGDGGSWPSMETLAKYANVSVRRARAAVEAAVERGELRREIQAGGFAEMREDRRPNRYTVLVTCPPDCSGGANHRRTDATARDGNGRTSVTERADAGDTNGRTDATAEPSLEPPKNQSAAREDALPLIAEGLDRAEGERANARTARPRDLIYDALAEAYPTDTPQESKRCATAAAKIKAWPEPPDPRQVARAARWAHREWPTSTPHVVAERWGTIVERIGPLRDEADGPRDPPTYPSRPGRDGLAADPPVGNR